MPPSFRIQIVPRAEAAIVEAVEWWAKNRTAAGDSFKKDLHSAFTLIRNHPGIGEVARNVRLQGVRRVLLGRVSYYLYYRSVPERETVEVLALWHTSRGAGPGL